MTGELDLLLGALPPPRRPEGAANWLVYRNPSLACLAGRVGLKRITTGTLHELARALEVHRQLDELDATERAQLRLLVAAGTGDHEHTPEVDPGDDLADDWAAITQQVHRTG